VHGADRRHAVTERSIGIEEHEATACQVGCRRQWIHAGGLQQAGAGPCEAGDALLALGDGEIGIEWAWLQGWRAQTLLGSALVTRALHQAIVSAREWRNITI
jgi:hypothetical protein